MKPSLTARFNNRSSLVGSWKHWETSRARKQAFEFLSEPAFKSPSLSLSSSLFSLSLHSPPPSLSEIPKSFSKAFERKTRFWMDVPIISQLKGQLLCCCQCCQCCRRVARPDSSNRTLNSPGLVPRSWLRIQVWESLSNIYTLRLRMNSRSVKH